jgi:uncharacterized protein (DUF1330 family)
VDAYARYATAATRAFVRHGGHVLARGGIVVELEGRAQPRNVVIEFESMDAALACYESAEYQAARAHRVDAAEIDLILLDGNPPTVTA